jgi:hypothetical protein
VCQILAEFQIIGASSNFLLPRRAAEASQLRPRQKVMLAAHAVEGFFRWPGAEFRTLCGCLAAADRPPHQLAHIRIGITGGGLEENQRAGVGDLAERGRGLLAQIADIV